MKTGKVWLVGAGPGDVGLLTIKGREALEGADVIVYDHLVNKDLLAMFGEGKEWIDVGKQAGHHLISQEEIQKILQREAKQGKQVVRLKGGDPFLFGRGGEEARELADAGIDFEIVPGVTSALAVPAYQGIPVTHRDYASSLHIITGHKRGESQEPINFQALASLEGTLVFLMGVTTLPQITESLMEAGMDPETPAAILQEGTTAGQRRVPGTLKTLAAKAAKEQIRPPAVIVVGQVCTLAGELEWYGKLPLTGLRILLARPRERMEPLAGRLRKKGAQVLEAPAIETVPIPGQERLLSCMDKLETYDWLVFTSPAGTDYFFQILEEQAIDIRRLHGRKIAVIGEGTGETLKKRGIYPDLMPETYDGVSLGKALAEHGGRGVRILLPRAEKGNQELVPILEAAGAVVEDVPIYRTIQKEIQRINIREELEQGRIDCVVLTSGSVTEGFARMAEGADLSGITAVCIGEQTAGRARRYGLMCRVAGKAALEGIEEELEKIAAEKRKRDQHKKG